MYVHGNKLKVQLLPRHYTCNQYTHMYIYRTKKLCPYGTAVLPGSGEQAYIKTRFSTCKLLALSFVNNILQVFYSLFII